MSHLCILWGLVEIPGSLTILDGPYRDLFPCKKIWSGINRAWRGEEVIIIWGVMNYENTALFLKSHAEGDNKVWINFAWPNEPYGVVYALLIQ